MSGATIGTTGTLALAAGAASAVGAGVSAYSQNQALRRQDKIAADSIRQQGQLRDQANQVVQKTIKDTATQQTANLAATKQKQQAEYLDALRRAAPTQNASQPNVSGASKAYADAAASAQKEDTQFGRTLADQVSTTDAPQLTQLSNNLQLGGASSELGLLSDTSNRQANLARLREQAVQANPWLNAVGQFISGAGAGYGASAGSGTSKYGKIPKGGSGIYADNGLGSLAGTVA